MGIADFIRQEGRVIAAAPATFVAGAILVGAVVWGAGTIFYKQEVAGAKQEAASARQERDAVGAQRDLFKDRLDLLIKAPPSGTQVAAPTKPQAAPIIHRGAEIGPLPVSRTPLPPDPTGNNVTSYYQSGGVTAGTINVGPQPRTLADDTKRQLLANVPKDRPITITALLGDGEAISFAADLFSFLKANGFKMAESGISQGTFTGPVNGTHVEIGDDKVSIVVGANLPIPL